MEEGVEARGWTSVQRAAFNGDDCIAALLSASPAPPWEGLSVEDADLIEEACGGMCTAPFLHGSPLCLAALRGHVHTVEAVLDAAPPSAVAEALEAGEGAAGTALVHAARGGHAGVVRVLLGRGARVEATCAGGCTALMVAAAHGGRDAAVALLDAGAAVDAACAFGWTALMFASHAGHAPLARLLVECGADADTTFADDTTSLMASAEAGHTDVARFLLESGARVGRANSYGWTALTFAANAGHAEIVRALLGAGAPAEPAPADGGWTPLMLASQKNHPRVVSLLLGAGARPDASNPEGWTALMAAAKNGHAAVVRQLVDAGASVDAEDDAGWTALHLASKRNHAAVARLLLAAGARADTPVRKGGWTALLFAARNGHAEVARALLEGGASPDAGAQDVLTPVMQAAYAGSEAVVQALLRHGSDPNLVRRHTTALDTAARKGHAGVAAALVRGGAIAGPSTFRCATLETAQAIVVWGGAPVSHHDLLRTVVGGAPPPEVGLFLEAWVAGTHPVQAERRACEAALLTWRGPAGGDGEVSFFPAVLVDLVGDYVHARGRQRQ